MEIKFIAIVLDNELLSVSPSEGVTQITSSLSSVYVDTKENLTTLLTALGIKDLTKLEEMQEVEPQTSLIN